MVVVEERPDLEVQRNALIMQSVENARRLLAVEDRILEVLLLIKHAVFPPNWRAEATDILIYTLAGSPIEHGFVTTIFTHESDPC